MHDVAFLQLFRVTVQSQLSEAGELGVDVNNAMATVIAFADGNAARVEEDEKRVEGGKAGAVGQCWTVENAGQDCFEASGVGGSVA